MLDFIVTVRSPILPIGVWFLSILIGLICGYFLMNSRKTLYRIPFIFLVSILYFFYIVLTWLSAYLAITTSLTSLPPLIVLALLSMPSFLLGFFLMLLCVMRARDGFGSKRAAWLIIAPIFNLGLFIVTLDDDKNDPEPPITRDPIWTAKFMNGTTGIIIATLVLFFAFWMGVQLINVPAKEIRTILAT